MIRGLHFVTESTLIFEYAGKANPDGKMKLSSVRQDQ